MGGLVPSRSSGVINREGGLLRRYGKAVCGVRDSAASYESGVFSAVTSRGECAASSGAFKSRGVSINGPARVRDSWRERESIGVLARCL